MIFLSLILAASLSRTVTAFPSLHLYSRTHIIHSINVHQSTHPSATRKHTTPQCQTCLFASSTITITQVQSNKDIIALADLRYDEWMLRDNNTTDTPLAVPSRHSFRLATAEIYHERRVDGATVLLARWNNPDNGSVEVVGAAEVSPIETRDCIRHNSLSNSNETYAMYATDVVTSSSHRRLGIGSRLMNAVEDMTRNLQCRFVFLHVEHDNIGAIDFYHRLGYLNVEFDGVAEDFTEEVVLSLTNEGIIVTSMTIEPAEDVITVNTKQLATNAGTPGQLLMVKRLETPKDGDENASAFSSSSAKKQSKAAAAGFGAKLGFGKKKKTKL